MKLTSVRTRAAICAAGAAVFALTAGTAIASADSSDDAFVAALRNAGITVDNPGPTLYDLGRLICTDLKSGKTPDQIAQDFEGGQGPAVVAAAKQAYCP
jgi:Protein of unknown function (DUF732)